MLLDLHSAFDASTLADAGQDVAVAKVVAGELEVPSGTIAAFDPLAAAADTPFSREVPAGTYRVELLHAVEAKRFALARIVFANGAPVRWELAVRAGEDARALRPGQLYGYGVDTATGCFVDGSAVEGVRDDEVIQLMVANLHGTTDAVVRRPAEGAANVIAFASGHGNGVYPSWWGLDAHDRALELVTDFGIGDFARPTIADDPAYRREWARARFDELVAAVKEMAASSSGDDGRMAVYTSTAEIASLEDDAAEIVPDLIRELRSWKHDEVAADPLIRLAKLLARHDIFQPEIAGWLATAPKNLAASFVFDHNLHRMQDELARVIAKIVPSISPMLLTQTVAGFYALEVGREPFRPWLITLAHRKDDIAEIARNVLRAWGD